MKLASYLQQAPHDLAQRGLTYYLEQRIRFFSEEKPGDWVALIGGMHDYNVEIRLEDDFLVETTCTCPYEDKWYCKHRIALVHAILEEQQRRKFAEENQVNQKMLSLPSFDQAARERIQQLGPEAMLEFIVRYGRFRPEFREDFLQW